MKIRNAAFLDEYLLSVFLRFISLLPPYPKPLSDSFRYENILAIKFWGIGTIMETTPLCKVLSQTYGVPIDLLTFSENRKVAESLGIFSRVHVIDFNSNVISLTMQVFSFIFKFRRRYSLVLDFEFFAVFSACLTKLLASKYSLGFDSFSSARKSCYSRTVVFDHSNHVRVIFLKFLDALRIKRPTDISMVPPIIPDSLKASALDKFPALWGNGVKIAININSSELSYNRRWPEENFRKLIHYIQRDFGGLQIYLIGGNGDKDFVESFYISLQDKTGVMVTAGRLDILEFTYALTRFTVLVTNDSGPLHIAEAVNTPVVGFFGPETHNLYGPLSEHSLVFYQNLYCSPCINTYNHKRSTCTDNQCLKLIDAEEVYQKLKIRYLDLAASDHNRTSIRLC